MERPVVGEEFPPLHPGSDRAAQPVIVELLGSHGQVRHRSRLTMLPAVIGRGYECDVILDDPHVCARHAELARDDAGGLVLRDLGSVNGIRRRGSNARAERLAISSGDRVRVGPVELRIVDASHPVPAAVPLGGGRRLTTRLDAPRGALIVCATAFLAAALLNYQASVQAKPLVGAIQEAVWLLAGIGLWASAWALATRIVSRGFRFLQHWAWSIGITVAGLVLAAAGEWIDFLGPSIEAGSWVTAAGGLAALPVLIAGHLEIASSMTPRRRWRAALSVGAIVLVLTLITSLGEEAPTWSIDFSGTLKPLPAGLISSVSLDEFMASTESLKGEVDALADDDAPDEADRDVVPDSVTN